MADIVPEIVARRAYRGIDPARVPEDTIDRVLRAATLAPSCSNNQPWRFVAISDSASLRDVKKHLTPGNYWAKTAPLIVAVCVDPDDDCRNSSRRDYGLFDAGLATQNLLLQAVREGLRAHPVAGFDPEPVKAILHVPDSSILIALVILGHPGETGELSEKHRLSEESPRKRMPESETIGYNAWSEHWNS